MALKVLWTPLAIEQLKSTLNYLELHWTNREMQHFVRNLDKRIELIRNYPELNRISERYPGTRECFVSKHNTLFFILEKDAIRIVTFWNNSQRSFKINT